jgi:uncharacterized membrane protein
MKQNLRTKLRSHVPAVKFPDLYCWYVLASTLDIVFTYIIIEVYKGWEANKLAAAIFERYGWPGMIALKYATVTIVLIVCEAAALKNERIAHRLAILAVAVGAFPVLWAAMLVWSWARHEMTP